MTPPKTNSRTLLWPYAPETTSSAPICSGETKKAFALVPVLDDLASRGHAMTAKECANVVDAFLCQNVRGTVDRHDHHFAGLT